MQRPLNVFVRVWRGTGERARRWARPQHGGVMAGVGEVLCSSFRASRVSRAEQGFEQVV
ncbi:MAG: hypothetical protein R3B40_31545 [Polyangiales bacterium]